MEPFRAGVARPRTAFGEDLDSDLAGVTIRRAADGAWPGQREQTVFGALIMLRSKRPKLAFRHRLMGHPVEHRATAHGADVKSNVPGVIR